MGPARGFAPPRSDQTGSQPKHQVTWVFAVVCPHSQINPSRKTLGDCSRSAVLRNPVRSDVQGWALLMHVVVPRVVSIIDGSREPRTDHLRTVMACGRDRGSWIRFGPGAPWRCFRDPGWPLCSCRSSVGPVGRPRRPVTYFLGKRGGSRRQAHRPLANEVASSSSSQALRSTDLEGQPWTAGLGRTS